jgi:hypothetical protein
MKSFVKAAVAMALLSACAQELSACAQDQGTRQANISGNQPPPSNFQSVGSCEPTGWASLERDSRNLPPDQRERVMLLLQDAQSQRAEANQGQCIITLQQAEKIVRQGSRAS